MNRGYNFIFYFNQKNNSNMLLVWTKMGYKNRGFILPHFWAVVDWGGFSMASPEAKKNRDKK